MSYKIVTALSIGTSGDQDFTSPGFGTPTGAMVLMTNAGIYDATVNESRFSLGWYDGTTQHCIGSQAQNRGSQQTVSKNFKLNDAVLAVIDYAATPLVTHRGVCSFITDGLRVSWSAGLTSRRVFVVLFKDASFNVGAFVSSDQLNGSVDITPLSQTLSGLLCAFNQNAFGTQIDQKLSLGFASNAGPDANANVSSHGREGRNPADGYALHSDQYSYQNLWTNSLFHGGQFQQYDIAGPGSVRYYTRRTGGISNALYMAMAGFPNFVVRAERTPTSGLTWTIDAGFEVDFLLAFCNGGINDFDAGITSQPIGAGHGVGLALNTGALQYSLLAQQTRGVSGSNNAWNRISDSKFIEWRTNDNSATHFEASINSFTSTGVVLDIAPNAQAIPVIFALFGKSAGAAPIAAVLNANQSPVKD